MLNLLISMGADINAKTQREFRSNDTGGRTPIQIAVKKNSKEIGEILISKGANINAKDIIYLNIKLLFCIKII